MSDPISELRKAAIATPRNSPDRTLLDLNLLPERHRGKRISLVKILPYFLILALVGLLFPAFSQLQSTQVELRTREIELDEIQVALASYEPLMAEIEGLQTRIDTAQARIQVIQDSYEHIQFKSTRWSRYLEMVLLITPGNILINSLDQEEVQIILNGYALNHNDVLELQDDLEATGEFHQVSIDFLARVPVETLNLDSPPEADPEEDEPPDYFGFQLTMTLPELDTGGQP
jgi:Tfp pilus assembly protein PilN